MTKKNISIVLPSYNEENNIVLIHKELSELSNSYKEKYSFEIIFVNDGSKDNTWEKIKEISRKDKSVKGISLSRNFGHQNAIQAGLKNSKGDAVVTMDCDLQHPVELIPNLIKKWEEGSKIVNTQRISTQKEPAFKRIMSNLFYKLINLISEIKIEQNTADFRLLDRQIIDELNKLPEKDVFYRGLVSWIGFENTVVSYKAKARVNGKSSYTFRKMLTLARTGITSFSMLPMKIIIFIGGTLFMGGSLVLMVMLYYKYIISYNSFTGSAILAAFIIVNNGILIMLVGILSIYQINMIKELKNRPNYIIDESVNI